MDHSWKKLSFFCALYYLQGAALAYVVNFQKPFLSAHGVSKESIGLFTSLLLVPFIAKVFLGMLSDRVPIGRYGSRKPYMLLGLLVFTGCYGSLAMINHPGEQFFAFALLSWSAALGLALFDTCGDGWAVDVARQNEQSSIQASMVAGKSLGFITMAVTFGSLTSKYGMSVVFMILAALSLLVLMLISVVPHQSHSTGKSEAEPTWRALRSGFFAVFAAFGVLYSVSSFGTDGLLTLFLTEKRNASMSDIGWFGMWRGAGALFGAIAFASAVRVWRLNTVLKSALVILGIGCLLPLLPLSTAWSGLLWGSAWGFQETAYVTLAMTLAKGPWSATHFAIAMIYSNVGTALGEAIGTPMAPRFGYAVIFAGFAALSWSLLWLIPKVTRKF